jgi:hypothetical protein
MRNRHFTLAYGVMLMLGMAGSAEAQDNGYSNPQRFSSFSKSICRNRSTRNLLALRKIRS